MFPLLESCFASAGFGGIFLVILALNLTRVRMNNPGRTSERRKHRREGAPGKMAHGISGVISLGVGYYLAVTTESPIQAIFHFSSGGNSGYGRNVSSFLQQEAL